MRQGNYFYKELPVSNSAAPVYQQVDVSAENPANVVTTKSGKRYVPKTPEAFSYDDDGNLLSDGRWSYTWDGENRLVAMEAIASAPADAKLKLEFLYDWRGRRIRKTVAQWNAATSSYDAPTKTTKFIYDGWNLLAEMENGVLARSYIWGPDLSGSFDGAGGVGGLLAVTPAGENPQMVFSDANGNVSMLADIKTGEVTAEYEYGPFGELVRSTGRLADENPFRFSSKYQDQESGLLYYGFRYYSSPIGKWLQRDPIYEQGGFNIYGFVNNNPANSFDIVGLLTGKVDIIHYVPQTDNGQRALLTEFRWKAPRAWQDGGDCCRCKTAVWIQNVSFKKDPTVLDFKVDWNESNRHKYTTDWECKFWFYDKDEPFAALFDSPGITLDDAGVFGKVPLTYRKFLGSYHITIYSYVKCIEGDDAGEIYATVKWGVDWKYDDDPVGRTPDIY